MWALPFGKQVYSLIIQARMCFNWVLFAWGRPLSSKALLPLKISFDFRNVQQMVARSFWRLNFKMLSIKDPLGSHVTFSLTNKLIKLLELVISICVIFPKNVTAGHSALWSLLLFLGQQSLCLWETRSWIRVNGRTCSLTVVSLMCMDLKSTCAWLFDCSKGHFGSLTS